ncbi:type IV secretory system conjugative DNA transfer family protein [Actinomyces succiniciruminis]|uniref:TraM recognition site of TraD and TraG n=1 Tax=Actinomyces succiniciruminis TaxID=1522002 RepID=A0A1L7RBM5_9ACTO|nr:type IV secretory system conjugative DNA transfer family protein [Actinomyces succiniciruminis]CED91297.1 TraM recognition site of TraD and TraG [Actinomyces succiniciruminis]
MSIRDEMRNWEGSTVAALVLSVAVIVAVTVLMTGLHLWAVFTGHAVSWNPWQVVADFMAGRLEMTASVWVCVAVVAVAGLAVVLLVRRIFAGPRRGQRRSRADKAAGLTGRPKDTQALSMQSAEAKAKRLGVQSDWVGLPIGRAVIAGRRWLVSSLEDVCLIIAGPRTGKTTCWVVPRILGARGAVLATSNKRDIVDETIEARRRMGDVLVFDPQQLTNTQQAFWWNPLSYVTDSVSASALTQVFVDATTDVNAQKSAYFDSAARDLVSALLLAAARDGRPITDLHGWLTNQTDREPVRILRRVGEDMTADTLEGAMNLVSETRSGVYGSASTIMSWLLNEQAMRWVTPHPFLPKFDPSEFVRSTGTLYCLSQEGRGSAAPVVTALTVAVTEAAVAEAKKQSSGRLPAPMLIELDEAANVCRWSELPNMYSHFGSRGIVVDTVLQSWSQGVAAWGEPGMKKLWSAANAAVYGGGVKEKSFLQDLSDMIGVHWVDSVQVSHSSQGTSRSTSRASQQRPIATVAELQGLPAGRAWVLASGSTAVLAELVPFWEPHPDALMQRPKAKETTKKGEQ